MKCQKIFGSFVGLLMLTACTGKFEIAIKNQSAENQGVTGVKRLSAGSDHTCVVIDDSLRCFGRNQSAQIGNGIEGGSVSSPYTVFSSGVTAVASGAGHTCAVVSGALRCFGANFYGQVGNGATSLVETQPHTVFSSDVVAAGAHWDTCAIALGGLRCFGANDYGQIGNGLSGGNVLVPFQVFPEGSGVTQVDIGFAHICAIVAGALWCSGNNLQGAIGNGEVDNYILSPYRVFSSGVTDLSVGSEHTCAVVSGQLFCFGWNSNGQIGNGSAGPNLEVGVPFRVFDSGVTAVAAGGTHTCAIVSGSLKCFGANDYGQIGNGQVGIDSSSNSILVPHIVFDSGVTEVSAGRSHTCAMVSGSLKCFGANDYGQIGNGAFSAPVPNPTTVVF